MGTAVLTGRFTGQVWKELLVEMGEVCVRDGSFRAVGEEGWEYGWSAEV